MMKRWTVLLAALAVSLLLCGRARGAAPPETGTFGDFLFTEREGFTTVITDLRGEEWVFAGVLQAASLEQHAAVANMASYAVLRGEEVILSVSLHDILPRSGAEGFAGAGSRAAVNGYYSAELPLGDGYTAFLTGLPPAYLAELQASALEAVLTDSVLSLEDLGFIDTEKQYTVYDEAGVPVDSDEEMCWAASTSNILHYTGWGRKAGFGSADYIFEDFIRAFRDEGGWSEYGLQWFFNGCHPLRSDDVREDFPGYLPDYCYSSFVRALDLGAHPESMAEALEGLREGCGAELGISWVYNWGRTGGHSISLWGMVYKSGAPLTEKDSLLALLVSDSDDSVTFGANRRTAPNTLTLCRVTPAVMAGYDSWTLDRYHWEDDSGICSDGILDGVTLLRPFSEDLTPDGGTRNTTRDPDWVLDGFCTVDADDGNYTPYLSAGSSVWLGFDLRNAGKVVSAAEVDYRVTVTGGEDGGFCREFTGTVPAEDLTDGYENVYVPLLEGLAPGTYGVEAAITCRGAEAYLSNNTGSYAFHVSTRSISQDDLAFEAEAVFDGPPNREYFGAECIGRLSLRYTGSLGYPAAQYSVGVEYESGEYQRLYLGKELPETVYGLKPQGGVAAVDIYVTPEDPALGYERFLGRAETELRYFQVLPEAQVTSFSTIWDTDSWLAEGESISLTFRKNASSQEDTGFYYCVYAENDNLARKISERWLSSASFDENGTLTDSYGGFYVYDWDAEAWSPVTLPAGSYSLWAYVDYCVDPAGYYIYRDGVCCGELTVLPTESTLRDISHTVLSASETHISYTLAAPPCDSLRLLLYFGTDPEQLGESFVDYGAWSGGEASDYLILDTEPETRYYYRLALSVNGGEPLVYGDPESCTFLTPAEAGETPQPPEPDPPATAILSPGENALELTHGGEVYLETFTPLEDGVWRFTLTGPDGSFCVWDAAAGAWGDLGWFTLEGKTAEVEVRAGQPVVLYLRAYMAGEYRILCEAGGPACHIGSDGMGLLMPVRAGETCFAAAYSPEGQLLELQQAETTGLCLFSFPGDRAVRVRFFRLDAGGAPLEEAFELSVPVS